MASTILAEQISIGGNSVIAFLVVVALGLLIVYLIRRF